MQKTLTRSGLDSNMLKLIAIAAMTVDHIAWLLFPGNIGSFRKQFFVWPSADNFAYHRQAYLPDNVLFHCRGLSLYAQY